MVHLYPDRVAETTTCMQCGGIVAPDGYCWDCGSAQPAYRAHFEFTLSNAAGVSDRGLRREINADAMTLSTTGPWTIGVVCDGVSMSPRPERAVQVAASAAAGTLVSLLASDVLPETALAEATLRASRAVTALATSVHSAPACTYVAGLVSPAGIWTCWVGDSRAYWLPVSGLALQLTTDDAGSHAVLSAWLGADAGPPTPQIRSYRPNVPGTVLLCTDGLSRYFPTADSLRTNLSGNASLDATALVNHALSEGGHDNITALLIRSDS
jgi:serine/threonine protein phosphatase PrpC